LILPRTTSEVEKPDGSGTVAVQSTTPVLALGASGGRLWVLEADRVQSYPMN
jgi:hypothetical protein